MQDLRQQTLFFATFSCIINESNVRGGIGNTHSLFTSFHGIEKARLREETGFG